MTLAFGRSYKLQEGFVQATYISQFCILRFVFTRDAYYRIFFNDLFMM